MIKLLSGLFMVASVKAFQFAVRTGTEWAQCLSVTGPSDTLSWCSPIWMLLMWKEESLPVPEK